ncbi:MAG: hypothetical protein RL681_173 [Candidatus Parcubacteria bacterium]|jgi:asparaginyl-tRNA synthetase
MKNLYARDLSRQLSDGAQVEFCGWVKSRRKHNQVVFLDVCDSTGAVQVVIEKARVGENAFGRARRVALESAVKIVGTLKSGGQNPLGEIVAEDVEVIGQATLHVSPQPRSEIDVFDPRLQEQLLTKRHLYLRNPKITAMLQFRHVLMRAVHEWFDQHGFVEIHAPILTPTPLYDDRTPIGLQVHGQHVYLTQCVGFYLEQTVHAIEKIYNIGPSFRAEESRSKRHLMEYWHIKAELAFVGFEDMVAVVESFIRDVSRRCASDGADYAAVIGTTVCQDGTNPPFPRIDYAEAVEWLKSQGLAMEFGKSLGSDEEALLSKRFGETPFWVVGIPRSIEPFPYVIDSVDTRRTKTADLIASRGFGELLGVAEKIHELAMLDERLAEKGKAGDERYAWLRELRQYGCVPHGGFGAGVERLIRWLLGIPHVRDVIPFPRTFRRKIHP